MAQKFLGYHSEWNLGSPGGWVYQRLAQEVGSLGWSKIKKQAKLDLDLDFDHPILDPVPNFAKLLFRAHMRNFAKREAFIALVAEEETLDKVGENIRIVNYLNSPSAQRIAIGLGIPKVKAVLIAPTRLELKDNKIFVGREMVTAIFQDFNNRVIIKVSKTHNLKALLSAIKLGLVTNPRGMEPIGSKGVFEVLTGEHKDKLSQTTVQRTPWTRQFYPRKTQGPGGEQIQDLVQWAKDNWANIILKPVHGYSGQGIIIGQKETDVDGAIKRALDAGDYIIQQFIPIEIWTEQFPWIDRANKKLFIKSWQTDFRCFVTDVGLIGFVTRFGGIPTNVGSGGGVQCTAVLRSKIPLEQAVNQLNTAILNLGYEFINRLQHELDQYSLKIGNVYLLGPLMNTLRPRLITEQHIVQLKEYAENLWQDALTLEKLWLEGKLSKFTQISPEEERIAGLCPWQGKPALIAADGLFGFTESSKCA
ncbi:hypothetical protein ACFL1I_07105 [Candidatus Omnitrophota bacterium]